MREIKIELIKKMKIEELGYDFMGYTFDNLEALDYHHLIVPRKNCAKFGLDRGYFFWNGAILTRNTAHHYLHFIEEIDRDAFCKITREMINENFSTELKIEYLKRIREILEHFEYEHKEEYTKKGEPLIKQEYIEKRISLK